MSTLDRSKLLEKLEKQEKKLEDITELDLSNEKISRINNDAFEGMINLSKLDLSQNEITNMDWKAFSNLTNLTELNLSRNKLKQIDKFAFKEMTNLLKLDLSQNEITKIDSMLFSNLTNLSELNLSSNKLKQIKRDLFSELGNLEFLYLEFNEIEEIGMNCFENNSKLKILIVNGNKISSIPTNTFLGLNNLVYLSLEFNYLTAITSDTFENLSTLKELNVASNRIKKINPKGFKNQVALESLDMSNNQIAFIDSRTFRYVKELKSLNLSSNKLKSIEPNIFKGMDKLEFLYLNNNLLTSVDREVFKDPINLRVLKLNNNKLNYFDTDCFANFRQIRIIQLYENPSFGSMSFYNLSQEEVAKNSFEEHRLNEYGYLSDWEEYLKKWNNLSKKQPLKSKKTVYLLEVDISSISKEESKTWDQEHTIIFDEHNRKAGLEMLNLIKDGTRLCIAYSNNTSVSGLAFYQHWFIMTNDESSTKYFIEFGSIDLDYKNTRVNINLTPRKVIKCENEFELTEKVRQRIKHVLGMKNFSLCLRNSEHVANYIYDGRWHSKQVEYFRSVLEYPMRGKEKFINVFPSMIKPHVFLRDNKTKKVYSSLSDKLLIKPSNESEKMRIREDFKALINTINKERKNIRFPIKFELDDNKRNNQPKQNTFKKS